MDSINTVFLNKQFNSKLTTIGALFLGYFYVEGGIVISSCKLLFSIKDAEFITKNTNVFNMTVLGYYK